VLVVGVLAAASTGCLHEDSAAQCEIGVAALGLVVQGVTHGRSSEDIGAFLSSQGAGNVLSAACVDLARSLADDPAQTFTFELELSPGVTLDENVWGEALVAPPLPSPPLESLVRCLDWEGDFLVQLCFDGTIGPPPPGP
jgi:hypothetical protein